MKPYGKTVVDKDTGTEVGKQLYFQDTKAVDARKFVKIFKPMWNIVELFKPPPAVMILCYIAQNLKQDDEVICIRSKVVMEKYKMPKSSFHKGINQLLDAGVIYRDDHDYYLVNRNMMLNGRRGKGKAKQSNQKPFKILKENQEPLSADEIALINSMGNGKK